MPQLHTSNELVLAMRELLDDPLWGPQEIRWLLAEHTHFPGNHLHLLERLAPVQILRNQSMTGNNVTRTMHVPSIGRYLAATEKVIVIRNEGQGTSHADCMTVGEMIDHALLEMAALIIRTGSGSGEARSLRVAEPVLEGAG